MEFEKIYAGCCKININDEVRRRLIPNIEARLINIIGMAGNNLNKLDKEKVAGETLSYDKLWLAVNRVEINSIFEKLKEIRLKINSPVDPVQRSIMEKQQSHFLDPGKLFDTESIRKNVRETTTKTYGILAVKKALAVTSASTVSFLGGPVIGGAVVTTTAFLAFSSGAAATYNRVKRNEKVAVENVEISLRKSFIEKQFSN